MDHAELCTILTPCISGRSLFDDPTLSDISVRYGEIESFAHKAILARRSQYFYEVFQSGFPVSFVS